MAEMRHQKIWQNYTILNPKKYVDLSNELNSCCFNNFTVKNHCFFVIAYFHLLLYVREILIMIFYNKLLFKWFKTSWIYCNHFCLQSCWFKLKAIACCQTTQLFILGPAKMAEKTCGGSDNSNSELNNKKTV